MLTDSHLKNSLKADKEKSFVYLDIGDQKLIIELFDSHCPKTTENFKELCRGYKREDGKEISFTGTNFDRIVENQFV